MALMGFMESMGTGGVPVLAAFFIGLMTAISPCPLATNIAAIAYVSKRINNSALGIGIVYTLGRMFTYVLIAALIVWIGLGLQPLALFLQSQGERLLGPLLVIIGIVMLDVIKLPMMNSCNNPEGLKKKLGEKGYLGGFLLGVMFALAFCPFSGMLYFGMLIPLSLRAGDPIFLPSIFALATGLPVMLLSLVLSQSMKKLSVLLGKVQVFELWTRRIAAVVFIGIGIYYIIRSTGI